MYIKNYYQNTTFTYIHNPEILNNTVLISTEIPYTFTDLVNLIEEIEKNLIFQSFKLFHAKVPITHKFISEASSYF